MMDGIAALKVLAQQRTDEVVFSTMSTISDWPAVSTKPELDVTIIRPMAKCSSMGLGLALARPDVRVWVLDGDGSLLMNLGSLVTIAAMHPRNLMLVVYQNGTYDTTGGQPVPGGSHADFAAMARGAGWRNAHTFDRLKDFQDRIAEVLQGLHPSLVALKVAPGGRRPFPELTGTGPSLRGVWELLAQRSPPLQP